jgi:hypothetical protein
MKEGQRLYLIKERNYGASCYLQAGRSAIYSSDVGTAIHDKLPSYIPEKGDFECEVISSDQPKFWEILKEELLGKNNCMGLEAQISDLEWKLSLKKKNRDLIKKVLNGKK